MINYLKNIDQEIVISLNMLFVRLDMEIINKFFAECLIYALPIVLLVLWFGPNKSKKVSLRATFSAILAWPIIAYLIGHFINRPRPFLNGGVQELIFHRPDYSFPSDHAAALFAVAFSFWLSGYKKLSLVSFGASFLIVFFRVASGIHYPSDILAGIAIGLISGYLVYSIDKKIDPAYNFIIKNMRAIHLG